jgi:acetate kinase
VILAVNGGSSSLKAALFADSAQPPLLARTSIKGRAAACLPALIDWLEREVPRVPLRAIGHRLVHGGMSHIAPERLTPELLADLTALIPFAPNHLPDELALISALREYAPGVVQVACFDTAFHRGMPEIARRLPIPREFHDRGIRRYGFHGLSCEFLMEELARIAGPPIAAGRVILAHLGSGSSLTAVANNRSIDTTMSFTPIGGVVMSTRSGDLDPGVVTFLGREAGLSPAQVEDLLSRSSGLLAIAGDTGDMQTLVGRSDVASRLAVESYVYSVAKSVGALAAALEGLDTIVFSGGIGQRAKEVRAAICRRLGFLGIELDLAANNQDATVISANGTRVTVRVIATDEEQMIARSTYRIVATE